MTSDAVLLTQYVYALANDIIVTLNEPDKSPYMIMANSVKAWRIQVHADGPTMTVEILKCKDGGIRQGRVTI